MWKFNFKIAHKSRIFKIANNQMSEMKISRIIYQSYLSETIIQVLNKESQKLHNITRKFSQPSTWLKAVKSHFLDEIIFTSFVKITWTCGMERKVISTRWCQRYAGSVF